MLSAHANDEKPTLKALGPKNLGLDYSKRSSKKDRFFLGGLDFFWSL